MHATRLRRCALAALTLVCAASGAVSAQGRTGFARGYAPANERPNLLRDVGWDQHLDGQVPLDTPFVDDEGRTVTLGQYFGPRPVFLALVYYECPMLCTQVLNGAVKALDVIPQLTAGSEFELVVISIDSKESPALAAAKKRAYLESYGRMGAERGFHFLTGSEESIQKVAGAIGFKYVYDKEIDEYAHLAGITLLTPEGRISRYFFGIDFGPMDLKLGVMDASNRRIGTVLDQVLLYCYHYDPSSGTYKSRLALNVVRAGGVLTMLGMVSFWIVMWRRDHRHAR
ncbi:MAG: SCO family protein [Vicinamibacterales bacterium]